ncbi:transcriptional regulator [Meiothermus cerbereus]|uniref:transcriptional regulator n=1 Tax=Meiothermus cerbereus TaxID=65552 RepID=UPI003EE9E9CC
MDLEQQAQLEAEALSRRVLIHDILRRLQGKPNQLLPYSAVLELRPKSESYKGLQTIEVDKIIGSVDRYGDFDAEFMPKEPFTLDRWTKLRQAQLEGIEFPPIHVYKVGDTYFVKDGNHRTALAKAQGQHFIDAYVVELEVPVDLDPNDTIKDVILKGEYAEFLEKTQLLQLRPRHEPILFSRPGRYDVLLDHIHTHQYFMGLDQKRAVGWKEAVADWYDHLYLPTILEIRENGVLKNFPGRTEADLYLWISDHRYYLSQAIGHDVGPEEATLSARRQAAKSPLRRLGEWLGSWLWRTPAKNAASSR